MKIFLASLILFFFAEFTIQAYHYFFPSNLFYNHSYKQAKGKALGKDYNFTLNSQGFKDTEFTKKQNDSYRILAIGDSFAFGSVPYQDSFLSLIETNFNQLPTGKPIELLNMGVPSIHPRAYWSILGLEGLAVDPDMLLLTFFVGDDFKGSKEQTIFHNSGLLNLAKKLTDRNKEPSEKIYHSVTTYCDTCQVMPRDIFLSIEMENSYLFNTGDRQFDEQLSNAMYFIRKIRDLCKREGIELLVVIIPDVLQIDMSVEKFVKKKAFSDTIHSHWDITRPNRALTKQLRDENIAIFDLYPVLKKSPVALYKTDDVHWNLEGNRLAAESVFTELKNSHLAHSK